MLRSSFKIVIYTLLFLNILLITSGCAVAPGIESGEEFGEEGFTLDNDKKREVTTPSVDRRVPEGLEQATLASG